jgi:phosphoglycolate phosphatase
VKVSAGGVVFDVDAIVFDKDGTLLDLQASWSEAARQWIAVAAAGSQTLARTLDDMLGYDRARNKLVPDGIIAAGTLAQLDSATRRVIGAVPDVDDRLGAAHAAARRASTDPHNIEPIGDLVGALRRLRRGGVHVGVLTSDDRATAEANLSTLAIVDLVDAIVGGDDVVNPKPDPEGFLALTRLLGAQPAKTLMVGDSSADMGAARAAAAAGAVAIGSCSPAAATADAVIGSIEELVSES